MGLVGILIGVLVVLVVLVGVLVLSTMLRARGHAVAPLVRPLVVEILLRRHQVASLVGRGMVTRVVALSHSLALLVYANTARADAQEKHDNRDRPQYQQTAHTMSI